MSCSIYLRDCRHRTLEHPPPRGFTRARCPSTRKVELRTAGELSANRRTLWQNVTRTRRARRNFEIPTPQVVHVRNRYVDDIVHRLFSGGSRLRLGKLSKKKKNKRPTRVTTLTPTLRNENVDARRPRIENESTRDHRHIPSRALVAPDLIGEFIDETVRNYWPISFSNDTPLLF